MDTKSIVRTVILAVALINQVLVSAGKSPIPVEDDTLELLISTAFTVVVSVWTWWKNNYVGPKGQKQKEILDNHDIS